MFPEPFVTDVEADGPAHSLPSTIYPGSHHLLSTPSSHAQVHQLSFDTGNTNAPGYLRAGHPPSCASPTPIVSEMKLRLVGDAASDASSRHSQIDAPQDLAPDEEVMSSAQRGSTTHSRHSTLPALPHHVTVPSQAVSRAESIPDVLVPGRMPQLAAPLPPGKLEAYSDTPLSQGQPLPGPGSSHPLPNMSRAWNSPWVPDPAWGYTQGAGPSQYPQNS